MVGTNGRTVTVFGGTGFLGRRVVRHLRDREFTVRIASRHPDRGHRQFRAPRQRLRSIPYPLESAKVVLGRGQRAVDRISEAQSGFTRNPSERSAFVRKLRAHDRRRCRTRTPRNLSSSQASRGPVGSAAPRSDGQSNAWPMTAGKTSMAGTSPAMTISRRGVDQGTAGQATSWT